MLNYHINTLLLILHFKSHLFIISSKNLIEHELIPQTGFVLVYLKWPSPSNTPLTK